MTTFQIGVTRIGYAQRQIPVEAENREQAEERALQIAGSCLFSEHDAHYELTDAPQDPTEPLVQWAQSLGLDAEDLDGIVHDAGSISTSAINNRDMESQIHFLLQQRGEEETRRALQRRADEKPAEAAILIIEQVASGRACGTWLGRRWEAWLEEGRWRVAGHGWYSADEVRTIIAAIGRQGSGNRA